MWAALKPDTLSAGIRDAAPMRNVPVPVPTISKRPSAVSACAVNFRGTFVKPAASAGETTVWRSPGFGPQTRLMVTLAPRSPATTTRPE